MGQAELDWVVSDPTSEPDHLKSPVRAEFEAWVRRRGHEVKRNYMVPYNQGPRTYKEYFGAIKENSYYQGKWVQGAWDAWQHLLKD